MRELLKQRKSELGWLVSRHKRIQDYSQRSNEPNCQRCVEPPRNFIAVSVRIRNAGHIACPAFTIGTVQTVNAIFSVCAIQAVRSVNSVYAIFAVRSINAV